MALNKIIFSPVDSEASGNLRIIQPLMALKNKYGIDYEILNSHDAKVQLRKADLVWLQCLIGPQQRTFIDYCKKQGVRVIIDYDDFFSGVPDNIQTRLGMPSEEITQNWHYYLQNADMITVPCQTLANEVRKVTSKPVIVLPNLIQKATYEEFKDYQPFSDTSEIRILYSCSESHLEDFKFIVPTLSWVGRLYPNVRILTNGGLNFTYHEPGFKGKASHIGRVSYGAYYSMLKRYQPHIFIAPLLDNLYNKCRSDLKAQQAALMKCAFLGSDIGVYSNDVSTGLLTNNFKVSWLWNLRKLLKNPEISQKMGESAYQQLASNLLEDHIHLWYKALSDISNAWTINVATQKCQETWKEQKAPIQVKSLINQLTLDIQTQMDRGEWDFAVKLSYYRHEIAKIYNSTDWYEAFVEIRKTRDLIGVLVSDDSRTQKDRT